MFAKGVRGPAAGAWQVVEVGHLRSAGGTALWGYALPPTLNKKGLGRGRDKTSKNLSVETPVLSPQLCAASAAEDLRRDGPKAESPGKRVQFTFS